jgi:ribosome biogenesis GTPase
MGTIDFPRALEATIGSWDQGRRAEFSTEQYQGLEPARILSASRGLYELHSKRSLLQARLCGRLLQSSKQGKTPLPVVGDWVALSPIEPTDKQGKEVFQIQAVLQRRNYFSRQYAGKLIAEQVIAANLDYLLIVIGLDVDFNLKRLDRYLVMAQKGGVPALVILSKSDRCPDVAWFISRTRYERDPTLKVLAVCSRQESSLEPLRMLLKPGASLLLVGSSGAGKSTLINALVGAEVARSAELSRGNGRGRCTTTLAKAYHTKNSALLIDTPGMRELQLWAEGEELDATFADLSAMAATCKFRDCTHRGEPGCKLREALLQGELTQERFQSYLKLRHEIEETHEHKLRAKRKRFKEIAIKNRAHQKWSFYGS